MTTPLNLPQVIKCRRIHHVGIAVKSVERAARIYGGLLGMVPNGVEELVPGRVRIAFYAIGETLMELLEPTDEQGELAHFIAERGEGLHHVAVEVPDVARALEAARLLGFALLDDQPRPGARHTMIGFADPRTTDGVLLEFVQDPS